MLKNRNPTRPLRSPALLALAATLPVGLLAGGAAAQPDYLVEHTFDIKTPGNAPPYLALKHEEYAYARCKRLKDKAHDIGAPQVFLGTTTFTQTAIAGTVSVANSEIDVDTLAVGAADGTIRVFGDVDLCPAPASAYGRAASACKLYYRGQKMDRRGRIGWRGAWRAEPGIRGGVGKVRRVDPIVARLIDKTTGEVTETLVLDIRNFVQGGWFEWDGDVATSKAPTMVFEIIIPGVVTKQKGRLRIETEFGEVKEVIAEGDFAGLLLPAVGDPAGFELKLPNEIVLDYDLGGDETHELEVEMELGGAGEHEEAQGEIAGDLYVHADIGTAYAGADPVLISVRPWMPMDYGVPLFGEESRAAVPISVKGADAVQPDHAIIRLVHLGAPLEAPIEGLGAVLWAGAPGSGEVVAAAPPMTIALDTTLAGSYAVYAENLLDDQAPVKDVTIDMTWAPPLEPGVDYWLELSVNPGSDPFWPVWPLSTYNADVVPTEMFAMRLDRGRWQPIQDPGTGRLYTLPFMVFASGESAPCYADCDESGGLDFFDFLCFQDAFAAGGAYADCDGSSHLDFFDFLCFQNEFAAGCP